MKLNRVVAEIIAVAILWLTGCQAGSGEPTDVAEQFMNQYYHGANVEEVKALAVPAVAEKMKMTLQSSAGVTPGDRVGTRKVAYTLKEKQQNGTHSFAIYEATITSKEAGSVRKRVHVSVDLVDGAWKIAEFKESDLQ